jgi:hypothetical protein
MKNLSYKFFGLLFVLGFILSCEKQELVDDQELKLKAASSMVEYQVNPKFGKPNSTNYYFKVYDPSGTLPLSVKLYERVTGATTYFPMTRVGTYWTLSKTISINGLYYWRYVYSSSKIGISNNPSYELCNTYNVFNSGGISSIRWPFGADGSSWTKRTVYVNGKNQTWLGGNEPNATGNGFGEGAHTVANGDYYGDDWNRGIGSDDLGSELRSPLDGTIIATGTYSVAGLGDSKFVSIKQVASDGKEYKFFFGHMNSIALGLVSGTPVRAGITKLGTLGKTGATSPHAHCSLRNITGGSNISVAFRFDAQ